MYVCIDHDSDLSVYVTVSMCIGLNLQVISIHVMHAKRQQLKYTVMSNAEWNVIKKSLEESRRSTPTRDDVESTMNAGAEAPSSPKLEFERHSHSLDALPPAASTGMDSSRSSTPSPALPAVVELPTVGAAAAPSSPKLESERHSHSLDALPPAASTGMDSSRSSTSPALPAVVELPTVGAAAAPSSPKLESERHTQSLDALPPAASTGMDSSRSSTPSPALPAVIEPPTVVAAEAPSLPKPEDSSSTIGAGAIHTASVSPGVEHARPQWFAVPAGANPLLVDVKDQIAACGPELSTWTGFYEKYKALEGYLIIFKRVNDQRRFRLVIGRNQAKKMSIAEWKTKHLDSYLEKVDAGGEDSVKELVYLTDISVPIDSGIHELIRSHVSIVKDCDEEGSLALNRQADKALGPDWPCPDVSALCYLSPPTRGGIITWHHYDAFGSQTSVHTVLNGVKCYNIVYSYPCEEPRDLDSESELRTMLGMQQEGKDDFPHQFPYEFPMDQSEHLWMKDSSPWRKKLVVNEVRPGQSILLPTRSLHCFVKYHDGPVTGKSDAMVGYSGNSSYLGGTAPCAKSHIDAIYHALDVCRSVPRNIICFPNAFLLAAAQLINEWLGSRTDAVVPEYLLTREQLCGVLHRLEAYMEKELVLFHGYRTSKLELVDGVTLASPGHGKDWICTRCYREIANLFHKFESKNPITGDMIPQIDCVDCILDLDDASLVRTELNYKLYDSQMLKGMLRACNTYLSEVGNDADEVAIVSTDADAANIEQQKPQGEISMSIDGGEEGIKSTEANLGLASGASQRQEMKASEGMSFEEGTHAAAGAETAAVVIAINEQKKAKWHKGILILFGCNAYSKEFVESQAQAHPAPEGQMNLLVRERIALHLMEESGYRIFTIDDEKRPEENFKPRGDLRGHFHISLTVDEADEMEDFAAEVAAFRATVGLCDVRMAFRNINRLYQSKAAVEALFLRLYKYKILTPQTTIDIPNMISSVEVNDLRTYLSQEEGYKLEIDGSTNVMVRYSHFELRPFAPDDLAMYAPSLRTAVEQSMFHPVHQYLRLSLCEDRQSSMVSRTAFLTSMRQLRLVGVDRALLSSIFTFSMASKLAVAMPVWLRTVIQQHAKEGFHSKEIGLRIIPELMTAEDYSVARSLQYGLIARTEMNVHHDIGLSGGLYAIDINSEVISEVVDPVVSKDKLECERYRTFIGKESDDWKKYFIDATHLRKAIPTFRAKNEAQFKALCALGPDSFGMDPTFSIVLERFVDPAADPAVVDAESKAKQASLEAFRELLKLALNSGVGFMMNHTPAAEANVKFHSLKPKGSTRSIPLLKASTRVLVGQHLLATYKRANTYAEATEIQIEWIKLKADMSAAISMRQDAPAAPAAPSTQVTTKSYYISKAGEALSIQVISESQAAKLRLEGYTVQESVEGQTVDMAPVPSPSPTAVDALLNYNARANASAHFQMTDSLKIDATASAAVQNRLRENIESAALTARFTEDDQGDQPMLNMPTVDGKNPQERSINERAAIVQHLYAFYCLMNRRKSLQHPGRRQEGGGIPKEYRLLGSIHHFLDHRAIIQSMQTDVDTFPVLPMRYIPIFGDGDCLLRAILFVMNAALYLCRPRGINGAALDATQDAQEVKSAADSRKESVKEDASCCASCIAMLVYAIIRILTPFSSLSSGVQICCRYRRDQCGHQAGSEPIQLSD
jgi:hypothetical protein